MTSILKRKRLLEENEVHDGTVTIKSNYWFEDGNIVLQAENTLFRVHRSILSHHSNVFKDMVSMPQPQEPVSQPEGSFEGCPLVVLGDKATDVECMISMLYDNFKTNNIRKPMTFDHLAAILRLGKKYQIDHFCTEGLRRIRAEFPTSYDEWKQIRRTGISEIVKCEKYTEKVINLAHELSIESVLPTAYFIHIMDNNPAMMFGALHFGKDDEVHLPPRAVLACIHGHNRLNKLLHELSIDAWRNGYLFPTKKCLSPLDCQEGSPVCFDMATFFSTMMMLKHLDESSPLCKNCRADFKEYCDDFSAMFWRILPGIFFLDRWNKLEDFDG